MLSNGLTSLSSRAVYRTHAAPPPPRLFEDDDDEDEEDEDSTDEYGSCTEAPLYENVHDDDDEDDVGQGVYENVVFEPPAYSNLLGAHHHHHLQDDEDDDDDHDGQVYANVPGLEDSPTYDVPQRRPAQAGAQPLEYANLPGNVTVPVTAPSAGGLGVIMEETESSSAKSTSGSSGRGSSCTSAASSLARSTHRPATGLSSLLSRIRGGMVSQSPPPAQMSPQGSPLVVGVTAKKEVVLKEKHIAKQDDALQQQQPSSRGSQDSGLNEIGLEWSSSPRGKPSSSPRTSFSQDVQQATPERLARVQQQVRQHMEDDGHYQQPRQPAQPAKLSVRDLLGHFEAKRAVRLDRVTAGGVVGGGSSEPSRSYGFGSSSKQSLRKAVSQPDATTATRYSNNINQNYHNNNSNNNNSSNNNSSSSSSSSSKSTFTPSTTTTSINSNLFSKTCSTTTSSPPAATPAPPAATATAPSTKTTTAPERRSDKLNNNSNRVNNKLASGTSSNASRRTFLDSIIAGAASADGSGRRNSGSRRATLEEVNNVINQVKQDDSLLVGNGHPALRKANTTAGSSRRSSRSEDKVAVDAHHNGVVADVAPVASEQRRASTASSKDSVRGSAQDIPSIVAQLPDDDDDRPQESRRTTSQWDPSALVAALYLVPEPLRDKPRPVDRVNVEGFLERLPSGRTKATFWNAWKRCYFRAKDGFLYCYAGKHSEKPMDVTQLMGGQVENFESMVITAQDRNPATVPVIGIDDRMGHYLVVRANTPQETDRWVRALQTHTVEDFCSTYVQPWPIPRAPALLRDSIVVDLGSRSVRAGILCSQPSLPQVFFPAVCASRRGLAASLGGGDKVYGPAALQPNVRSSSTLSYPIRPTERINKHTVDLAAVAGFLRVVFQCLSVDPRDYGVVLSVPRTLDSATQARLVADLFDRFGVRSVLLSHQTVLALYAYNAASGVVVDVGERTDVVPIMDGYIVEGGVSRVPYGGEEMSGHVRRFLLQRAPPVSLGTVAEALLPRYALERLCFVSATYRADLKRAQRDPTELAASVSVSEFFTGDKEPTMESLTLDVGRFQAPEGLFHPQAWGLDHPGVHRMVHKAIQECSMDARKTMARSVFLAGGLTMLPGFVDRLRDELAALLPPAAQPKVHASPYRYHAAYLGACVLANSSGVQEMCLSRDEYNRDGGKLLRPWIL